MAPVRVVHETSVAGLSTERVVLREAVQFHENWCDMFPSVAADHWSNGSVLPPL